MKELWVEKYRPKTVDGYVFRDDHQRKQINTWIKDKSIPHLLLSGAAGIGKTTLAKILIHEIGIEDYDVLEINASRTNSVEDVRDKITNFVQMIPCGPFKVVLLDEADYLSPNAQAALRGVMEEYHSTSRFILTCNYPNRIIPAIHSRCQGFHVERTDQTEFTARVATILVEENVEFDEFLCGIKTILLFDNYFEEMEQMFRYLDQTKQGKIKKDDLIYAVKKINQQKSELRVPTLDDVETVYS
jgi:replication factor C small subunit